MGGSECWLSPLDSARFGITVARARLDGVDRVPVVQDWAVEAKADLLIARCSTTDLAIAQALEERGHRLMDCLVYWERSLTKALPEVSDDHATRIATPSDADQLAGLAGLAFVGYRGHYHSDARLPDRLCDEGYASWARRSVTEDAATAALVAVDGPQVLGFATLQAHENGNSEVLLNAVLPHEQGRGIYSALVRGALVWAKTRGDHRMIISTQVNNVAVQRVWARNGYEPFESFFTFHWWAHAASRAER